MSRFPQKLYSFLKLNFSILNFMIFAFFNCRMYSSIETPSNSSESHQHQYQYHSNAFNIHSTANVNTAGAATMAKSNENAKSIIRPSNDAHMKQSSTIFNNNNSVKNKLSYGAYSSTCSNNNFENVNHNIRSTMFNEKM